VIAGVIFRNCVLLISSNLFDLGFNIEFLKSKCALLKLFEIIIGSCCEMLLVRFALDAATEIGRLIVM